MSAEVAVIMLSRDHWAYTETALRTLADTRGIRFETIVVDNGSDAQTIAALDALAGSTLARRLDLSVEKNPTNSGVAAGRNQGARRTSAHYLLFLDNDVEIIDAAWLESLVAVAAEQPKLGTVGGVLLNADGSVQFAGGRVDQLGRLQLVVDLDPEAAPVQPTMFALGACMLTPRVHFESIRGFDEMFGPMHFEDVDYALRLAVAGHPSAIALRAKVLHHGHVTTGSAGFTRMGSYLINGRRFLRRWQGYLEADESGREPRAHGVGGG